MIGWNYKTRYRQLNANYFQNLNAQLVHAREENSQYIDLNSKLNEDCLKVTL